MADIVLVSPMPPWYGPPHYRKFAPPVPLGLLSLATILNASGYSTKIIDMRLPRVDLHSIDKHIQKALAVGLSVMTMDVLMALRISQHLKERSPSLPVIWGGVHPTLFPRQVCKDALVDYAVIGEGEQSLVKLVERIESGKSAKDMPGVAYESEGKTSINHQTVLIDPNDLPPTNWELIDVSKYLHRPNPKIRSGHIPTLDLCSSRGCPHRCAFCINTIIPSCRVWRPWRAERVLEEIEIMVDEFGVEHIEFQDENFFVDLKRVKKICDLMKKRNIDVTWQAQIRADYFRRNNIRLIIEMARETGLTMLGMGAESGSERVLHLLQKDITTEDTLAAARICGELGVVPYFAFMFGVPSETQEEIVQTLRLIGKIYDVNPQAIIRGLAFYRPYPGSKLYELSKENGLSEPIYLRGWTDYFSKEFPWRTVVRNRSFLEYMETLNPQWLRSPRYLLLRVPSKDFYSHARVLYWVLSSLLVHIRYHKNKWTGLREEMLIRKAITGLSRSLLNVLQQPTRADLARTCCEPHIS